MASASAAGGGSRRSLAIILAVIGILAVVVAVLYVAAPTVLPHFMYRHGEAIGGHTHNVRAAVSGGFGIIVLIVAGMLARSSRRY